MPVAALVLAACVCVAASVPAAVLFPPHVLLFSTLLLVLVWLSLMLSLGGGFIAVGCCDVLVKYLGHAAAFAAVPRRVPE